MNRPSHRRNIVLTVEPLNNQNSDYRFGLMSEDLDQLKEISKTIKSIEVVLDNKTKLVTSQALTVYRNYGKLVNPLISEWIISNKYNETERGKPTKLIFVFKATEGKHTYKLYKNKGK
ncbi:MAG: hypothetical protein ACOYBS_11845 [Flavobacterium sp.]